MTANTNPKTGISYGVIAYNSLNPDLAQDLWSNGTNVTEEDAYKEARVEFRSEWQNALEQAEIAASEVDGLMSDGEREDFIEAYMERNGFGPDEGYIDRRMDGLDLYIDEPTIEGECDGVSYAILHLGGAPIVYITESPHRVHVKSYCSPCVPNAGDLDSGFAYDADGDTYGPPLDWLSDESKKELIEED